jgi:CRP/FNR family cyclic AMP-dependent transcriptional regulator
MHSPVSVDPTTLSNIPIFRGLSHDELARLATRLRSKTVRAGVYIMSREDPGDAVYIIVSGTVKVHAEQADGRNVILSILGEGETLGEMAVLEETARSANALAIENTRLLWMPRSDFLDCLRSMPDLTLNLARMLSRRFRFASARVESLTTMDVDARLARQLLALAQEYGQNQPNGDTLIPLRLTQDDLADMIGASRTRVNQVQGFFRERGLISVSSTHRITIHNPQALAARFE